MGTTIRHWTAEAARGRALPRIRRVIVPRASTERNAPHISSHGWASQQWHTRPATPPTSGQASRGTRQTTKDILPTAASSRRIDDGSATDASFRRSDQPIPWRRSRTKDHHERHGHRRRACCIAADPAAEWEQQSAQMLADRFRAAAEFTLGERTGVAKGRIVEAPRLRWTNPAAGTIAGLDYLVLDRGVPVAYCSIYQWLSPGTDATVDLTSLSSQPVSLALNGRVAWNTSTPGVTWAPAGDLVDANASATLRLTAMRRYAREFQLSLERDSHSPNDPAPRAATARSPGVSL